jgi:hypothetical protein
MRREMLLTLLVASVMASAASAGAAVEDKAAYLARCRQETLAQYPDVKAQVDSICGSKWDMVVETGPMAEAMLALAPAEGTAFDPDGARGQSTSVKWGAKQKGQVVSGKLGEVHVGITRKPVLGAAFSWFKEGTPIPFDLEGALRVRGVSLTMIGCLSFGAGESTRVYRASGSGKAPFALTVAAREAALASQSSDYSATADFSGKMPTLAALKSDGSEWAARCPA